MKPKPFLYICASVVTLPNFTVAVNTQNSTQSEVDSLRFLCFQKVLNPAIKSKFAEELNKQSQQGKCNLALALNSESFEGKVIGETDFSGAILHEVILNGGTFNGTNFSNADFTGARIRNTVFNETNFQGADLRDVFSCPAYFKGCIFKNVNLNGALLYGDKPGEYLYQHGVVEPLSLIRQYSDLIKKIRLQQHAGNVEELESLKSQAQTIKNLISDISDFKGMYLNNLDLTGLDIGKLQLQGAHLQETRLSENVIVPNYKEDNRRFFFDMWVGDDQEKKDLAQQLLNSGFNIFRGVYGMEGINWGSKDLRNADLSEAHLVDCDFSKVNLKEIYSLKDANIINLILKNIALPHYESMENCTPIFNMWVGDDKEICELIQNLLNLGVNIFRGVDNHLMQQVDWGSKNLKNANFNDANLSGCDFSKVNLKEINDVSSAMLSGLILSENVTLPLYHHNDYTPLFNLWIEKGEAQEFLQDLLDAKLTLFRGVDRHRLQEVNWKSKKTKNANFSNTNLADLNLSETDLSNALFRFTQLQNCNLNKTKLNRAQIEKVCLKQGFDQDQTIFNCNTPQALTDIYKFDTDPAVQELAKQILEGIGHPIALIN